VTIVDGAGAADGKNPAEPKSEQPDSTTTAPKKKSARSKKSQ
jgi:hypothetical protein